MTGTAIRKTEPHQKTCSSAPPITGPSAIPTENMVTHSPIAMPRWRGSPNIALISDRVEGIRVAPAIPRAARLTRRASGLVASAATIDATPKAAAPIRSSFRRPMRSPRLPIVTSRPAIMKP